MPKTVMAPSDVTELRSAAMGAPNWVEENPDAGKGTDGVPKAVDVNPDASMNWLKLNPTPVPNWVEVDPTAAGISAGVPNAVLEKPEASYRAPPSGVAASAASPIELNPRLMI